MHHKAEVSKEGRGARLGGCIQVTVGGVERTRTRRDLSILAAEIANLASLSELAVAYGLVGALKRIEMAPGSSAVAVGWHGCRMDVISCGTLAEPLSGLDLDMGNCGDILKGPPVSGSFRKLILKLTPTPSGWASAEM